MNAKIEFDYHGGRYIQNAYTPWSAYISTEKATYHGWGFNRCEAMCMAMRYCFNSEPHVFDRALIEPEPTQMYADEDMFPPGA